LQYNYAIALIWPFPPPLSSLIAVSEENWFGGLRSWPSQIHPYYYAFILIKS